MLRLKAYTGLLPKMVSSKSQMSYAIQRKERVTSFTDCIVAKQTYFVYCVMLYKFIEACNE